MKHFLQIQFWTEILERGEEKGNFNTTECFIFYIKFSEQDILALF